MNFLCDADYKLYHFHLPAIISAKIIDLHDNILYCFQGYFSVCVHLMIWHIENCINFTFSAYL